MVVAGGWGLGEVGEVLVKGHQLFSYKMSRSLSNILHGDLASLNDSQFPKKKVHVICVLLVMEELHGKEDRRRRDLIQ